MSNETKSKKKNSYEKCFCYNEAVCEPFKHWNRDGLFQIADLIPMFDFMHIYIYKHQYTINYLKNCTSMKHCVVIFRLNIFIFT